MSGGDARVKVGIVFGGRSLEHAVSVRSARSVLRAIDRDRFEPLPLGVTREGVWLRPVESEAVLRAIEAGAPATIPGVPGSGALARPQALEALNECDVVFPLIHGLDGENGSLQGLLELAGLPYVGAGVAASAIGMDKALQKALFRQAGLPVVPHRVITAEEWCANPLAAGRGVDELTYPVFVKPANGGSSIATHKVHSHEELAAAIGDALRIDRKVLAEQAVRGREIECAILGNAQPAASPLGEIRSQREFYDYTAKYHDPTTELIAPVSLPAALSERIQALALAAYQAIDCAGMGRVDFFVEEPGAVWVSEINTIPGFTDVSMFPRLWEAGGLPFPALIQRLVDLALERHEERQRRGHTH